MYLLVKKIVCFLLFSILLACGNSDKKIAIKFESVEKSATLGFHGNFETLRWMEGIWVDSTTFSAYNPPMTLTDSWKWYADSIGGISHTKKGKDSADVLSKLACIRNVDGVLTLVGRPIGEPMVVFKNKKFNADTLVFENKAHAFPRTVSYVKAGNNAMELWMEGSSGQFERKIKLKFFRI